MFYIRHRKLAAILRFGFHFCNSSNYFLTTSKSNSTWKWQSYNDFGGEKKKKKKKGQRGSKLFARPAETLCKFLSSDTRKTLNQKRAAVTCQTCRNPRPPSKKRKNPGTLWTYSEFSLLCVHCDCELFDSLWNWSLLGLFFNFFCLVGAGCWLFLDSEEKKEENGRRGDWAGRAASVYANPFPLQNTTIENAVYSSLFGHLHTPTLVFFSGLWKQVC